MIDKITEFMIPGMPGDLQALWVGEKLKPYCQVLYCEGNIYTERTPPELCRELFKKVAGIWVRPCTWLQIGGDVYNFIIPEIYPEYGGVYAACRTDGIFRHIPDSRGPVEVDNNLLTMIKSSYGV